MAKLQRVVIRDDLVEDAKRIQQRYALRSWGDAINFVFAAHRSEYLTARTAAAPPPISPSVTQVGEPVSSSASFASPLPPPATSSIDAEQSGDLRDFLSSVNYSLDAPESPA